MVAYKLAMILAKRGRKIGRRLRERGSWVRWQPKATTMAVNNKPLPMTVGSREWWQSRRNNSRDDGPTRQQQLTGVRRRADEARHGKGSSRRRKKEEVKKKSQKKEKKRKWKKGKEKKKMKNMKKSGKNLGLEEYARSQEIIWARVSRSDMHTEEAWKAKLRWVKFPKNF